MIVTTNFPCGNGRVHWINPGHFEVEAIAYSKAPRYTTFRIIGGREACMQRVIIRPDSFFPANFLGLSAKIWVQRGLDGEWQALPESEVEHLPEAFIFTLALKAGETVTVSLEPPRDYGTTTAELFAIAGARPHEASLHFLGASIEQRPIFALRISGGEREEPGCETRPVVLISAGEHATEFAGEEMVRGMLRLVLADTPFSEKLRRDFIFDFVLNENPDGNYHGWHQYNAKDWREHNYAETVDRSWHHEFEPYMTGEREGISPETAVLCQWFFKTRPTLHINAHSWLGHQGHPGAFHADPTLLPEAMGRAISELNRNAKEAAASVGLEFPTFSSKNLCSGHLGSYLMKHELCITYTIEGHMSPGRETLQLLGERLLKEWLSNPELDVRTSRAPIWDAWLRNRPGLPA